jgi:putative membrane protein
MAGGIQSDPRVHFAAERTFLAWMRTGLAFMGFGFVVARFGLFLRELAAVHSGRVVRPTRFSMVVGTGLILIGVLVNIVAAINHVQLIRELREGIYDPGHPSGMAIALALLLAAAGIAMAIYLVLMG